LNEEIFGKIRIKTSELELKLKVENFKLKLELNKLKLEIQIQLERISEITTISQILKLLLNRKGENLMIYKHPQGHV